MVMYASPKRRSDNDADRWSCKRCSRGKAMRRNQEAFDPSARGGGEPGRRKIERRSMGNSFDRWYPSESRRTSRWEKALGRNKGQKDRKGDRRRSGEGSLFNLGNEWHSRIAQVGPVRVTVVFLSGCLLISLSRLCLVRWWQWGNQPGRSSFFVVLLTSSFLGKGLESGSPGKENDRVNLEMSKVNSDTGKDAAQLFECLINGVDSDQPGPWVPVLRGAWQLS